MNVRSFVLGCSVALALTGHGVPVWAQGQRSGQPQWEVEGFGGDLSGHAYKLSDGSIALPPAGDILLISGNRTSRRASSWYFGDGAALLNQVIIGFSTVSSLPRLTPLDAVLGTAGVSRRNGVDFGVRIGRTLTPRFTVEIGLDAAQGHLKFTPEMLAGIEASRASFVAAFNGIVGTGGGIAFTNSVVTSDATVRGTGGRRLFTTGSLRIDLPTRGRIAPYATIGAGMVTSMGDLPDVQLAGNYRFNVFGAAPVNETDTVNIRVTDKASACVRIGGGVRILGAGRWGLRADLRAYLTNNSLDVLLDAKPNVATLTPAGAAASLTTPSIQFSNNAITGLQSSLSGPAISGFRAFAAGGQSVQVGASLGYFVRF